MGSSTTYAVVLAAGAGTRLGGISKGRLLAEGEPLIARAIARCRDAGIPEIRVVIGAQADQVRPLIPPGPDLAVIDHPDWAQGRTSSLQAGVRDIPRGHLVLLYPVDCYAIGPSVIPALLDDAHSEPYAARTRWTPVAPAGRGHPILFTSDLIWDLLQLAPNANPRELFRAVRDIPVAVSDNGIVRGVKTSEDLVAGLILPVS